jgi:predicted phosphodiesterase
MSFNLSRILFAGDPHGNFKPIVKAVIRYQPEAVIMLGDYDLEKPLDHYLQEIISLTQIWWIAGNHDFLTASHYNNLFKSALADHHLHLQVKEIAGLRIAGLSGIFLGRVWYPPKPPIWQNKQHFFETCKKRFRDERLSLKLECAIWHNEFEALKALKADVLVCHEAPNSHRFGFSAIGELAAAMEVKYVFHGHLHENYAATLKSNITVIGVADQAVTDLAGIVLIDGST